MKNLNYTMKGQPYELPLTVQEIVDEEEAKRIRWLATYSTSDTLFEAARALIMAYDHHEMQVPGGILQVPALLFPVRLLRLPISERTLDQANTMRNTVLAAIVAAQKELPEEKLSIVLPLLQEVISEKTDAFWWCDFSSADEANAEINALMRLSFRHQKRAQAKGEK
jgi:hypothetical protein